MAMFSSNSSSGNERPTQPAQRATVKDPGLSIISPGMKVTGEMDSNGVVKVEGEISGSVRAEGQVLVAKGGMVDGDILTREAIVAGEVKGAIYADERVEVQASSVINGDIVTQRIVVAEGGEVNGRIKMENPDALNRTRTPRTPVREVASNEPSRPHPQPATAGFKT